MNLKASEQITLARISSRHQSEALAATAFLASLGVLGLMAFIVIGA